MVAQSPAGGNRMNSQGFNPATANPLLLAARLLPDQLAATIVAEITELTRGQDERVPALPNSSSKSRSCGGWKRRWLPAPSPTASRPSAMSMRRRGQYWKFNRASRSAQDVQH